MRLNKRCDAAAQLATTVTAGRDRQTFPTMKPTAESAITLCLLTVTYGQVMTLRGDLAMAAVAAVVSVVWAITAVYRTFRKD